MNILFGPRQAFSTRPSLSLADKLAAGLIPDGELCKFLQGKTTNLQGTTSSIQGISEKEVKQIEFFWLSVLLGSKQTRTTFQFCLGFHNQEFFVFKRTFAPKQQAELWFIKRSKSLDEVLLAANQELQQQFQKGYRDHKGVFTKITRSVVLTRIKRDHV